MPEEKSQTIKFYMIQLLKHSRLLVPNKTRPITSESPSVALGWYVQIALINRVISDTPDIWTGETIPAKQCYMSRDTRKPVFGFPTRSDIK